MTRAPNLDANDKLVKRGLLVSHHGYRAKVLRVRVGRCLVEFVGCWYRGHYSTELSVDQRAPKWLPCASVQVVQP